MNFEFTCPQCGQMVEADESFRGQVAQCPHCGKGIVVPRVKPRLGVTRTLTPAEEQNHRRIQHKTRLFHRQRQMDRLRYLNVSLVRHQINLKGQARHVPRVGEESYWLLCLSYLVLPPYLVEYHTEVIFILVTYLALSVALPITRRRHIPRRSNYFFRWRRKDTQGRSSMLATAMQMGTVWSWTRRRL